MMKRSKGFTLIELLVVILILAILMAIALPLYLRAVADSERQTCRSNMQTIANAEQAYKVRSVGHVYTEDLNELVTNTNVNANDPNDPNATVTVAGDLQAVPVCPTGGTYSVTINYAPQDPNTEIGFTVSCTNPAHGSFTPGQAN